MAGPVPRACMAPQQPRLRQTQCCKSAASYLLRLHALEIQSTRSICCRLERDQLGRLCQAPALRALQYELTRLLHSVRRWRTSLEVHIFNRASGASCAFPVACFKAGQGACCGLRACRAVRVPSVRELAAVLDMSLRAACCSSRLQTLLREVCQHVCGGLLLCEAATTWCASQILRDGSATLSAWSSGSLQVLSTAQCLSARCI